jgi:hypothetical protein
MTPFQFVVIILVLFLLFGGFPFVGAWSLLFLILLILLLL